jgi:L-ascorbate metabolism protein UlaG (beta-lactamase superfamily)
LSAETDLAARVRLAHIDAMKKPYHGPISDHYDGTRFFVPGHNGDKSQWDVLKWALREKRAAWPKQFDSPHIHQPQERVSGIRSTLIGHASFLLQMAGINLLIDPVFADRASPISFAGPKRLNAPGVAFDDLPPIDAVLLTHNHYDHLDKTSLWRLAERFKPQFVGPLGVDHDVARGGKMPGSMITLDWGQQTSFGEFSIHAVPTYHWSARSFGDRRKTLWCSFVVTSPVGTVYHIGDTGYGAGEFSKQVSRDFGRVDLAHIPIGAYEPRWFMKDHHVNPEEAVQILKDCGANKAIGHHWGTFQLTNEGHDQPQKDLAAALEASHVPQDRFQAFRPGQSLDIV